MRRLDGCTDGTILSCTESDIAEGPDADSKYSNADGAENVEIRLLFSVTRAYLNNTLARNGLPFTFTSIAGMASDELTHDYVRSYLSLNGRTAFTAEGLS